MENIEPIAQTTESESTAQQPAQGGIGASVPGSERENRPAAALEPAQPGPPTLDLLLDVELPLSISFGKTYLPVREILKLSTGSIVELNCPANAYVEVIVNNCTIARGEVVVIEGNYGVRIDEIISRRDRMLLQHRKDLNPQFPVRASA